MNTCKEFGYLPARKVSLQNIKPIFAVIQQVFDLECHGQASLKVMFSLFGLGFLKFRKLKIIHTGKKELDLHKT